MFKIQRIVNNNESWKTIAVWTNLPIDKPTNSDSKPVSSFSSRTPRIILVSSSVLNHGSYVWKRVSCTGLVSAKHSCSCRKGISASCLPYKRTAPSWCKSTAEEVEASVCRLAKKGLTPSQIGVMLRDQKGIGQVKAVTGSKILRILKKNGKVSAFRSWRHRTGPFSAWGYVLPHQEGRRHQKAPGAQPKGPRLQVPSDSDREPYPPSHSLLQAHWAASPHLEVVGDS